MEKYRYPYKLTITKNKKVIEVSTHFVQFKLKERVNEVVMGKDLSKLKGNDEVEIKIERKFKEEVLF